MEKNVRKAVEEFESREKAFEVKTEEAQAALHKRGEDISAREQASLARVQEQKDAAVAAILEQKRKWAEERKRLEGNSGDVKKEQPAKAGNGSAAQPMDVEVKEVTEGSENLALDVALSQLLAKDTIKKDNTLASKPRPELKSFCESKNAEGLRAYIAEHRKDLNAIGAELPSALKLASDPAQLVLKALEGYYPSEPSQGLPATRRACVVLLEALSEVLADPILGIEHPVVHADVKKSAKQVADSWRSKMNLDGDLGPNFSLDAQSFLQLLATFGLASDFDQDELCKLVIPIARRKQTPALCRAIGLAPKIPDLVEKLSKDGKQIEALSFASAFELLDRFQPVPLLKAYLRDVRKVAQGALKGGKNSAAAQNDANQKELSALKAVLRAISEYKLEESYPPAPLEKRVAQLEKAKEDKKRSATAAKTQNQFKKPRTNSAPSGGAGIAGTAHENPRFHASDRTPYGGAGVSHYGTVSQSAFDHRSLGGYSSLSSSYLYPSDDLSLGSLGYGSSVSVNPSGYYSGYNYGSGLSGLGTGPSGYQSYLH